MKIEDLARWMRDEHETVEELTTLLRREVVSTPRTHVNQWLAQVRNRFEHFRAHLLKHMALEEQDGYLPAVTECRPTLSGQVARLRHEHRELAQIMNSIHGALAQVGHEDRLHIRECRQRIENVLDEIQRHEADEDIMVMSVINRDIGTRG